MIIKLITAMRWPAVRPTWPLVLPVFLATPVGRCLIHDHPTIHGWRLPIHRGHVNHLGADLKTLGSEICRDSLAGVSPIEGMRVTGHRWSWVEWLA
jgi:hypothetical protein